MPAITYAPTHLRVQYHPRHAGAGGHTRGLTSVFSQWRPTQKIEKTTKLAPDGLLVNAGNHLRSHTLTRAVPSPARRGRRPHARLNFRVLSVAADPKNRKDHQARS